MILKVFEEFCQVLIGFYFAFTQTFLLPWSIYWFIYSIMYEGSLPAIGNAYNSKI